MKKCKYNNPDIISSYYEGILGKDLEKKFSNHLLACEQCTRALLNLEKDVFLMNTMEFKNIIKKAGAENTVFQLVSKDIKLIKSLNGLFFTPVLLPTRGTEKGHIYRMEKNDIKVSIGTGEVNLFYIEISGVYGKSVSLFCNNRLVEAKANMDSEKEVIPNLMRGRYAIIINGKKVIDFTVK